jgi:O-antigen/teichoic acid export membrane protein
VICLVLMLGMNLKQLLVGHLPRSLQPWWDRLETSPLGYRLARGAFWSLAGAMISRGLTLLASILIARMLGKDGFGELGIIQGTVGMFGVFAGLGLGQTGTKYIAEFHAKDPVKAGRIMSLTARISWLTGGVGAVLLIVAGSWLAEHTLAAPHLGPLLQGSCALVLFSVANGTQIGALSGFEAFRSIAWANLISGLLAFPLLVLFTWRWGLEGSVGGLTASIVVNWALTHFCLRRESQKAGVPFAPSGWQEEWSVLWRFSLPAFLSGIMMVPVNWVCSAILANRPGGFAELGVYSAANQIFSAVLFLPSILTQPVLPTLTSVLTAGDRTQARKILVATSMVSLLTVLPFVICGCLLEKPIMSFYGPRFAESGHTLLLLLLLLPPSAIYLPAVYLLTSSGKMWNATAIAGTNAAFFLVGTMAAVDLGASGIALGRLLANIFSLPLVSPAT